MKKAKPLGYLAAVAALVQCAFALPQAGITAARPPIAWVTVDPSGAARTITPDVITTEGHRATVSEAPSELRSTATYTLSPDGLASTYTGLAPVASATGTGGSLAGIFPACDSNADVGPFEPFCLPKDGSELHPGETYYITWSPTYFSPQSMLVRLQAIYSPADDNQQAMAPSSSFPVSGRTETTTLMGFTSADIPASVGFYPFTIPPDFLTSRGSSSQRYNITFVLALSVNEADDTGEAGDEKDGILLTTWRGPTVYVTPASPGDGGKGPNLVAILVPIVVGLAVVAGASFCVFSWRRHGRMPLAGVVFSGGKRGGGPGYGERQSRSERVGSGGNVGGAGTWGRPVDDNKSETGIGDIQLTDRESWSPTGRSAGAAALGERRNVFREELQRQERLR
ncbi:hypothetical protein P885DRAFT_73976 [Corynascus similis CBS 632.67]